MTKGNTTDNTAAQRWLRPSMLPVIGERVIVAQVPTQGVFTIYSVIGDLIGWLSVAGLLVMVALAFWRGRKATPLLVPAAERPLPV